MYDITKSGSVFKTSAVELLLLLAGCELQETRSKQKLVIFLPRAGGVGQVKTQDLVSCGKSQIGIFVKPCLGTWYELGINLVKTFLRFIGIEKVNSLLSIKWRHYQSHHDTENQRKDNHPVYVYSVPPLLV